MDQFDLKTKNKILTNLQDSLFPEVNPVKFLPRLFLIHILATAFVMTICPQFGLGLFKNGHYGLTDLFMLVSAEFCQIACGAFLTLTSAICIWWPLKITEKEWLLQHKYVLAGIIVSITSGFFWMQAPEIHLFEFALWICGSLLALTGLTEVKPNYSAS